MTRLFQPSNKRPFSLALMGGAFGDEGKGRIVDEFVHYFLTHHPQVIQYRDNGGANAGHTVEVGSTRLALHQVGSGILQRNCTVISGKGMVIHPQDLVTELQAVKRLFADRLPARYLIDDMAVLCLDTHRALENVIKTRTTGSRGATGRGISPAYADIINRMPLRFRDLADRHWRRLFTTHYHYYTDMITGLLPQTPMAQVSVAHFDRPTTVGSLSLFLNRLSIARRYLLPHIQSVHSLIETKWQHSTTPFIFEKAQALGLDTRFGVYPDVTVSDCSYQGILASTEGLIDPQTIAVKAAVIKATYTSSVGIRELPSSHHHLTEKIRQDAHEYGATTGRPRDIHYLDLPLLTYLFRVGSVDYLCPTHLDISYPQEPLKVCVAYKNARGQNVPYRPDQTYLSSLKPVFKTFKSWDSQLAQTATSPDTLPPACLQFLQFLSSTLNAKLLLGTTGPKRHQTIKWF